MSRTPRTDAIRAAYDKVLFDARVKGLVTPPPSWSDVGDLLAALDEAVNSFSEGAKREADLRALLEDRAAKVFASENDRLRAYAEQLKAKALFVVGILECEGLPKVAEQLRQAVEGEKCVHETDRHVPEAVRLLQEWIDTETDPEDGDEYVEWMESFTARAMAVIDASRHQSGKKWPPLPEGDVPDHQNIADMLPSMLLEANARCPLCGQQGSHPHSAAEIVIYRNGVKYGRMLVGERHQVCNVPRASFEEIERGLRKKTTVRGREWDFDEWLRAPKYQGGHDADAPDPLLVECADHIRDLRTALASQIDISNGLRIQLESRHVAGKKS